MILSLRMLADVRDVWPKTEAKIFTADLIARLRAIEDGPWASDEKLDGRKVGRYLRPFGIKSATVQIGDGNRKGYYREDAETAFGRYLSAQPSEPSAPA